jgi:D-inositol-3-phosphate glycosyltransferase
MVSMSASPLAAPGRAGGGPPGIEVGALSLALGARGHDVVVHTRRAEAELPAQVRLGPGVRVHHVEFGPQRPMAPVDLEPFIPRIASELAQKWLPQPPDVVHAHDWDSGVPAAEAAAAAGVPIALTFPALGSPGAGDGASSRLDHESHLVRGVDRVLAASRAEVRELLLMGAAPDRVVTVPAGVDTTQFTRHGPEAMRGSWRHRLLSLSELTSEGGVDNALRILAQVPEAELVVAGGPLAADLDRDPDVARLRALARQLEVGDRVSFLGAVPRADRPALIRSADAVVCLPRYELSVRVVLEAMACGRPVVAAASGGLLDVVDDGVTGLLVEPLAPSSGALAVRRLLAAPGLRHAMSESARSRAEDEFDWRCVAQAVEEVYLAMRPPPGSSPARVWAPRTQPWESARLR